MIKKLLFGAIVAVGAYFLGVRLGFNAAVHDYAYNDAELIQSRVEDLDGTRRYEGATVVEDDEDDTSDSEDQLGSAFQ